MSSPMTSLKEYEVSMSFDYFSSISKIAWIITEFSYLHRFYTYYEVLQANNISFKLILISIF